MPDDKQTNGIVLSGMRPTGDLHIGHFEGVLRNWVKLQESYACFYFVADWHALTTELDTRNLKRHTLDMVKDWLAFGVDPEKSTIFIQSCVPEHAELGVALERLINIGTIERTPTFKGYVEHLAQEKRVRDESGNMLEGEAKLEAIAKSEVSLGFLSYPVLQAADILLYSTTHVPVGEDQLPHIELTRNLAKRFNRKYGELFTIPEAMLGEAKRVRGTDGRKMSKSYGNDISPGYTEEEIAQKVRNTITDRKRLTDNGNPFECPVYDLHQIYNQENEIGIQKSCREASIRCLDCKSALPGLIAASYDSYRKNREGISDREVQDLLKEGNKRAGKVAHQMMEQVKSFLLMDYLNEEGY